MVVNILLRPTNTLDHLGTFSDSQSNTFTPVIRLMTVWALARVTTNVMKYLDRFLRKVTLMTFKPEPSRIFILKSLMKFRGNEGKVGRE